MKRKILLFATAVLFSMASAFAQGGTTGPLTWQLTGMSPYYTLTISGVGEMPDYDWGGPWSEYNASIMTIVIENGVTTIGSNAFVNCHVITITIPNSVTTIGNYAFGYCNKLTSIKVDNGNAHFSSIDGVLFNKDKTILVLCPLGKSGSYTVPSGVIIIGQSAFYSCTKLTSVTISNSVTTIGNYAFSYCYELTSIDVESGNAYFSSIDGVVFNKDKTTLILCPHGKTGSYTVPNGVKNIGSNAFRDCQKLNSVTLGNDVTTIESSAFFQCLELETVSLGNSVTIIANAAFMSCRALTSVTFPNSVTTIGGGAFTDCCALTSVTIPSSVLTIGTEAFGGYCSSLTSINVDNGNPNYSSNNGVLFNKDKTTLLCYPAGKTAKSYTIPNSVTTIGEHAFYYCRALSSVILGNNVTTIGGAAFNSCDALTSIALPNSVTTIGYSAFGGCSALTSVTLGNSITTIENYAFAVCTALTSLTNLNPEPVEISYYPYMFNLVDINACTLKVLKSAVIDYGKAEIWKEFNIVGGDYLVVTSVNNFESGYIIGNEILYVANEEASLMAVPSNNYKFINWTKGGVEVSTENPYSFTVTEDIELVANFEEEVGIEKFEFVNLKIYPNPTSGQLKIECEEMRIEKVEIFDVFGKKVLSKKSVMTPETMFNISHLPAGVYFLRISTEAGEVVRKVVKE
ncbi:MAG: leucine-rich repeat protein [Bacteroidales bacterium]|jgi:uncharacterized protein YjfI (DUF2170 family)|nr:leucine-rich repeat protein [Bacteroidales bacterium]